MIPTIPGINTGGGGLSLDQNLSDDIKSATRFNLGGNAGLIQAQNSGLLIAIIVISIIALIMFLRTR